jgi:hypothetical protein
MVSVHPLHAVCCALSAALSTAVLWWMLRAFSGVCVLLVVCCAFPLVRCLLHIARYVLSAALRLAGAAQRHSRSDLGGITSATPRALLTGTVHGRYGMSELDMLVVEQI